MEGPQFDKTLVASICFACFCVQVGGGESGWWLQVVLGRYGKSCLQCLGDHLAALQTKWYAQGTT